MSHATSPTPPATWTPGRAELFAALVPVAMVLGILVLVLCGLGEHGSRVRLGLDAPDAPVSVQAAPVACEEDQPCWDPATMGNGLAGARWTADGTIVCPARMVPWDTEDVAVGDHGVLCRTIMPRG